MQKIFTKWLLGCFLLLGFGQLLPLSVQAQCSSTVITNNAATSGNFRGFNPRYMSGRTVFIISAAEMAAAGITNGTPISGMTGGFSTLPTTSVSGTFVIYMQNSTDAAYSKGTDWTTATTGMTMVHNNPMSVAAGATAWGPSTYTVAGTPTTFTYTGGSVYVATEWTNCGARDLVAVTACNNSLVGGVSGLASLQNTASCIPATAMASSNFRPFVNFVANFALDIVVRDCWAQGKIPLYLNNPQTIGGSIANSSNTSQTVDATFTIKDKVSGTVRHTNTQSLTIAGCGSQTVSYSGWSHSIAETDSIILTTTPIAGEASTTNNRAAKEQVINANTNDHGLVTGSIVQGVGFNTSSGILSSKYSVTGTALVKSVRVKFGTAANTGTGNTVYGVVLNSAGTIVAQSANYVIQASDLGNYVTFTMPTPPSFTNEIFYVGMAQTANPTGYFPWASSNDAVRQPGNFYTFAITGGTATELTNLNSRFWQEAEMLTYEATFGADDTICAGSSTNLAVTMSAGTSPYTLVYSDGTTNTTVNNYVSGTNIPVSPTTTTTYSIVSVVDSFGVYSTHYTDNMVVTVNPRPTSVVSGGGAVCDTLPDVLITLTGTAPWTFIYTNGTTPDTVTTSTSPYVLSGFGTYTVTALSDANCTAQAGDMTGSAAVTATVSSAVLAMNNTTSLLINENFDSGLPGTWVVNNLSSPVGTLAWFRGNPTVFPAYNGVDTTYVGANFNSTTGNNTISNWLIMPNITMKNGDVFSFYTRTVSSPAYPDRLQVRMSTNGTSTDVGATSTSVGDFTTVLVEVNPALTTSGYPNTWTQFTATISGLSGPTSGRLAFRYFITSGGPTGANSDYIGIDAVTYTTQNAAPTTLCAGENTSIKATITGGTGPYTVIYSDGTDSTTVTNYTSGAGITVTPAASATYSLVSVTDVNGCMSFNNTGSLPVTVNPIPSITGLNASYCSNAAAVTLTGTPSGGIFQVNGTNATTFDPATALASNIITYVKDGCNAMPDTVAVNAHSTVSLAQTGGITSGTGVTQLTQACAGTTIKLKATTAGPAVTNYQWQRNGVDLVGQVNDSLELTSGWGVYRVRITNVNACLTNADTFSISFRSLPNAQAGTDKNICTGSSVTLGVANNANYTYSWFPTTGLSNTTISNPVATPSTGPATYTVHVSQAITGSGGLVCSKSDDVVVNLLTLPTAPSIAVTAPTALIGNASPTLCEGAGTITLTPSGTAGNLQLQWLRNSTQLSLTNNLSAVVNIANTGGVAATYTARVRGANGCFSTPSNAIVATINAAAQPTITPAGTNNVILLCFAGSTSASQILTAGVTSGTPNFAWYQVGTVASVGSGNTYTATVNNTTTSKTFNVKANYANGCVRTSANKVVRKNTTCRENLTGDNDTELVENMTAYPNPTSDKLYVNIQHIDNEAGTLTLSNTLGQVVGVYQVSLTDGKAVETLDMAKLPQGVYNLTFETATTQQVVKVVKE